MTRLPLIAPNPPRLSEDIDGLRRVEASGVFSNNGPEVRAFETEATAALFDGRGASLAVANATSGLMIAIRDAAGPIPRPGALALMPAMTFAATAQAAIWAGLTPLVCDIDPDDWSASAAVEDALIARFGDRIAVVVPYATFGNAIPLDRYAELQRRHGIGVVVDAAASLGTRDAHGDAFGAGAPFAVVHSMHATKSFAVGEGGLVHSGDAGLIGRLRAMANFGFEAGRSATLPGINAKLPEVQALQARAKLRDYDRLCAHRSRLEAVYRERLHDFTLQRPFGRRRASQFMPVLLPRDLADRRAALVEEMAARGIGCGQYFSPHLGEQPFIRSAALIEPTPVADDVARRIVSLPITDAMSEADATEVAEALIDTCGRLRERAPARPRQDHVAALTIIGGGPAGTAVLTAAGKAGLLPTLSRAGLTIVERDDVIGGGRLGGYAITSDSTATTFLSAVAGHPHSEVVALADHPAARTVGRYTDALGVPLIDAGPLIRATGLALGDIVTREGGTVLTGHEVAEARQARDGGWRLRLVRRSDGAQIEHRTRAIVIATGGHQPLERLAHQQVAGASLMGLAGDRLVQSDEVLAIGGMARLSERLADCPAPRIAVVGGSTSALATVALLLKQPQLALGAGAVTLLHRRPLRPFYPSVDAARADGFTDFGPDDICPVSGFVYRLAGFRLEARALLLRMLSVGGRVPDPRVALHRIAAGDDLAAQQTIHDADIVVAALGYRPVAVPLLDARGRGIRLAADSGAPMVDGHCRILGAGGRPIDHAFGIGLAAGFVPWGKLGGEPSFRGQANGLWLWQNDVGRMIVEQALGEAARQAA